MSTTLGELTSLAENLPWGMRRLAEFIVADPARAARSTITELAEASGASPATINRFSHKAGFGGFKELRVALAQATGRAEEAEWQLTVGTAVAPDDPLDRIAAVVANGNTRAIQATASRLDFAKLEQAVSAIAEARWVHVFGVGGSHLSAEDLRLRLHVLGLAAWGWCDIHEGLTAAAQLTSSDVLVSFSHGGRTREAIEVQQLARKSGAKTIAVTNRESSPLARAAEIALTTTVPEGPAFRSEALAARHAQLFLVDLIFVGVANRDHDRALQASDRASDAVVGHLVSER